MINYFYSAILLALLISCQEAEMTSAILTEAEAEQVPEAVLNIVTEKQDTLDPTIEQPKPTTDMLATSFEGKYSWLDNYHINNALGGEITVPNRYRRVEAEKGSFAEWLRFLPLKHKDAPVLFHDKTMKPNQKSAYRVVDIDVGTRDLQQCADAVMRLKAEYHYSKKEYDEIHFDYTSGHTVRYSDWVKGKRPRVKGSKVYFSDNNQRADYSYYEFKKYLQSIYLYAGTASLEKELIKKPIEDIAIGDVFIKGGFPGHAVIVVDMAKNIDTGEKIFLLAQSYMPAQSIHVLNNYNNPDLTPWYAVKEIEAQLITPEWTFNRNALRAFE